MRDQIVVFGYGVVGEAVTHALIKHGRAVRVVQRTLPVNLCAGASFQPCDVLDAEAVARAVDGADQIIMAIGFPYHRAVWQAAWPRAMHNLIAACERFGTRMVFVDNLYMYGPQTTPLHEDMPLTTQPAIRAEVTRIWMAAQAAGRVKVAALRASDFYGIGCGELSQFGDRGFGALAKGAAATLIVPPDLPHDVTYIPDIARAVATLLDAPDDAFGHAWHVPNAPIRTPRDILAMGAKALNVALKIKALPLWMLPMLGVFMPVMREVADIRHQIDRAYHVDTQKFGGRFWSNATPFEVGVRDVALSYAGLPG